MEDPKSRVIKLREIVVKHEIPLNQRRITKIYSNESGHLTNPEYIGPKEKFNYSPKKRQEALEELIQIRDSCDDDEIQKHIKKSLKLVRKYERQDHLQKIGGIVAKAIRIGALAFAFGSTIYFTYRMLIE